MSEAATFDLGELRERTLRAHAWGGPGAVAASPAEVLALIEIAEEARVLVQDWETSDPEHPGHALSLALGRFAGPVSSGDA